MKKDGFAAVLVVIIVLAVAVIGGIVYVNYVYLPQMAAQKNNIAQSTSTTATTTTTSTSTLTSTLTLPAATTGNHSASSTVAAHAATTTAQSANSDIARVKVILQDIRQSFLTGNYALFAKHASASTLELMPAMTGTVTTFTINNVYQSGADIVASVTLTGLPSNQPPTQNLVFIKEAGDWKLDVNASILFGYNQSNANQSTGATATTSSEQISILYPTNGASFAAPGPATVTWTDSSNDPSVTFGVWVSDVIPGSAPLGTLPDSVVLSPTLTRTQAGCSASDKCSYPLSIPKAGTYHLSVSNPTNGARQSVTFTITSPLANFGVPLQIVSAALTPSLLAYPFSNAMLNVSLKNNSTQTINQYYYRFFLDENHAFAQQVGNTFTSINPGAMYNLDASILQEIVGNLATSCDFFGLSAGQYHLHLKLSVTTQPLNADTTGPDVSDVLMPFTLTSSCTKK
jgi:hypothetical protein